VLMIQILHFLQTQRFVKNVPLKRLSLWMVVKPALTVATVNVAKRPGLEPGLRTWA